MKISHHNTTVQYDSKYHYNSRFELAHPKLNPDQYRGHLDSSYVLGRPLIGIIILASLFLCTLIGALLVILIFCKKKNTVFVLPKSSLSEAWRSSIEMNSFHSGSAADMNGYGDWLMLYNGKIHPVPSSHQINNITSFNNNNNNNAPMSVESAFLLHLIGSNKSLSTSGKCQEPSSKLNMSRSQSCYSNMSFKIPKFSLLKRAVSKRGLKLSSSKTYERLNDPEDNESIGLNQATSSSHVSVICNRKAIGETGDVYGCAISSRPWLKDNQDKNVLLSSDYTKVKVNINRKVYGIRNVFLATD